MWASQHLLEQGFYVPPIVQIGVPEDQPRLRFFISANHTEAEILGVIAACATCRRCPRKRTDDSGDGGGVTAKPPFWFFPRRGYRRLSRVVLTRL